MRTMGTATTVPAIAAFFAPNSTASLTAASDSSLGDRIKKLLPAMASPVLPGLYFF